MIMNYKLIVIDVDGTMTDGGVYYDENGNEFKKFSTKDAAGFFAARQCGIKTMVLTGRECAATFRRMKDLNVDYVYQGVKNKASFLKNFISCNNIKKEQIIYIGDDLNDYSAMKLAGFVGCPSDSCIEIIRIANYVSSKKGGEGVVRDVLEHLLKLIGSWENAISEIYDIGV